MWVWWRKTKNHESGVDFKHDFTIENFANSRHVVMPWSVSQRMGSSSRAGTDTEEARKTLEEES
jgi:hypothetical protein